MFSRRITHSLIILRNTSIKYSQIRNTHLLRRKTGGTIGSHWESKLIVGPYLNERQAFQEPRKIAEYLYDYVEDTDDRPDEPIKIILIKHVEELGVPGDIVVCDANQARFHLILPQLAVYASSYNLKKYQYLIESGDREGKGPSSPFVMSTCRVLAKEVIPIEMSAENEWTIEKWHVRAAFRKAGFVVPIDSIELPKTPITGPDIEEKQGKDFAVFIVINAREKVPVRCTVHHIGVAIKANWFYAPRYPLLPEEQNELLASMPVQISQEVEKVEEELFYS